MIGGPSVRILVWLSILRNPLSADFPRHLSLSRIHIDHTDLMLRVNRQIFDNLFEIIQVACRKGPDIITDLRFHFLDLLKLIADRLSDVALLWEDGPDAVENLERALDLVGLGLQLWVAQAVLQELTEALVDMLNDLIDVVFLRHKLVRLIEEASEAGVASALGLPDLAVRLGPAVDDLKPFEEEQAEVLGLVAGAGMDSRDDASNNLRKNVQNIDLWHFVLNESLEELD